MTITQPQWRYVPFVSTLLMSSGLFMLLHAAPQEPPRSLSRGSACEGLSAPSLPRSLSGTPALNAPDDRDDAAKAAATAPTHDNADADLVDDVILADAKPWSPLRSDPFGLRGPPSSDDADATHRIGTGPVDSSFDATDDDDDGDDDADTDDGDGVVALVTVSTDASRVIHTSSLLSRVEVHHPVSFTSDVRSLRAPPQ